VPSFTIRAAGARDAEALAPLLEQLGYPAAVDEIRTRLDFLDEASAVLVAESAPNLLGFVAVAIARDFIVGRRATILGLVVADGARSAGIGAALLAAAERLAFERGAASMGVRSNVVRERAHRFYERLGYRRVKSQHVFEKLRP
jgi:ribosomal protein S18 acetylase RimI-like enzyme